MSDDSAWQEKLGLEAEAGFLRSGAMQTVNRASLGSAIEAELARNVHQLPLFVPVGLAIGVVAWFSGGPQALWFVLAIAATCAALAGWAEKGSLRRSVLIALSALILIGFALISWRAYDQAGQTLDKPWFGRFYAHVERTEIRSSLGKEYLYLNTQFRQGLPERVRVSRSLDESQTPIAVGDTIIIRARLMPPAPPAVPGAYDFSERAFFSGIGATGSILGPVRVVEHGHSLTNSQSLQKPLSQLVQSRISGDAGAIAATLASGDRGGLSAVADEWMRASGMAHLLSISGLHVTALVAAVYLILSRIMALFPFIALRTNIPLVAAAAGAMAAVFYTWLTGMEVPTIRSCIAALLILAAVVIGREPLSMRLLAIGATIVIIFWPESVMGPSFQLSFAAVAAIIALHDSSFMRSLRDRTSTQGWAKKSGYGLISLFLSGLLVEVTLSPIALFHFQQTGLYGALANMIAIPLTTFLIMPLIALSLALDWTGIIGPLWAVAEFLLNALLTIAKLAATAPGARLMTPTFPPWSFGVFAMGLIWLYLLASRIRWAGLLFMGLGLIVMVSTPSPDVLIDGSGRHLAIRDELGRAYFLRAGQGEFVGDMMQEQMGQSHDFAPIERHPGAQCNAHICLITMAKRGWNWPVPSDNDKAINDGEKSVRSANVTAVVEDRRTTSPTDTGDVTILVTRSNQYLDYPSLIAACAASDIAVSDRPLPKACNPKWIKADLFALRKTGGIAIYIGEHKTVTVADTQRHLPWSTFNPIRQRSPLMPPEPTRP